MTDTMSPVEVKGGAKASANPKQIAVIAVLGLVLVILLVTQLPKLLGGGSDSGEATTPDPAAAAPVADPSAVSPPAAETPAPQVTPPPERPSRSPFDVPR